MMAEQYAVPGQLIVGTDSHTPHSGAVGCLAFGVGSTDMANSMVHGVVRLTVPETVRVELVGPVPAGVTAKDVVLHLLALPDLKAGAGVGKATASQVGWLASPPTVAASAIAGELLSFDELRERHVGRAPIPGADGK